MRKRIYFGLTAVIAAICLFTGCAGFGSDKNKENGTEVKKDVTGTPTPEISPKVVEEVPDNKLTITQDESEKKIDDLSKTDGFEVSFVNTAGDVKTTCTFGSKDGVSWGVMDGAGYALKKDGDSYIYYNYTEDDGYTAVYKLSEESAISMAYMYEYSISYWLYFGNLYDGLLKKEGEKTVAGRKCSYYSVDFGIDAGYTLNLCVDNEYGFTTLIEGKAKLEDEVKNIKYEVTSFASGNDVKIPKLKDSENITDLTE
ncbi:MAG: hypothetical protein K6B75_03875 [Lachnospiraceae bacterium]|nr:hypothetical protein [Lachnospiraceae bacterium]